MTVVMLEDESKPMVNDKPNIKGDRVNIIVLTSLYVLQGGVYGFALALPIVFQNRNVSYADQAEFSLVSYPYCFKLLWAPLIDCVFFKKFGRRKTWIIPSQYLIGITLFFLSRNLDEWLGNEDGTLKPRTRLLTVIFFWSLFFCATQDVALDGWSLTMLQRRNVGYAGTCQNVGQAIGQFSTYILATILDSKELCNIFRSVHKDRGFVSLAEFMFLWSMLFMVITTLVLIFKKDNSLDVIEDENCECRLGLKESYKYSWTIFKLRPVLMLCVILLTFCIGFGPQNGVAHLKMMDNGLPRDKFVLLTVPALPFQILLSIMLRRSLTGSRSMHAFVKYNWLMLVTGVVLAIILFFAPFLQNKDEKILPIWYNGILLFVYNVRSVFKYLMILALGAFFCRISDPRYGGIYLTLMNTVTNIGTSWPVTLCLWLVDLLTIKTCAEPKVQVVEMTKNWCVPFDGFFTETVIFTVLGALWLCWSRKQIYNLEKMDASEWLVERGDACIVEDEEKLPVIQIHGVAL